MTTPKTIIVRVTQALIDEGYHRCHDENMDSCYNDPIALALNEATGETCVVGYASLRIGGGEMIPQPPQVNHWKNCFTKSVVCGVEEQPIPMSFEFTL